MHPAVQFILAFATPTQPGEASARFYTLSPFLFQARTSRDSSPRLISLLVPQQRSRLRREREEERPRQRGRNFHYSQGREASSSPSSGCVVNRSNTGAGRNTRENRGEERDEEKRRRKEQVFPRRRGRSNPIGIERDKGTTSEQEARIMTLNASREISRRVSVIQSVVVPLRYFRRCSRKTAAQ